MFWLLVFTGVFLAAAALILFLVHCFGKFNFIIKISKNRKGLNKLISLAIVLFISLLCFLAMGAMNTMIVIIHFGVIMLCCEGIAKLIGLLIKKKATPLDATNADVTILPDYKTHSGRYYIGIIGIIITISYLGYGWYMAHNIWEKDYTISTDKNVEKLRLVQIADSHIGTTFSGREFGKKLSLLEAAGPDIIVITGDFVDDDSSLEDMLDACSALGSVKTKYGVFYVCGNQDKGYNSSVGRGYTYNELLDALTQNNVQVLQDEIAELPGGYSLVGRLDRSEEQRGSSRAPIAQLMDKVDPASFSIVLDHQPNDYQAEAAAGADLVLSGHTHGGQFIPILRIGELLKQNDKTYGYAKRGNTHFVVTSGISDWALAFKTGCRSEFVVIDIDIAN